MTTLLDAQPLALAIAFLGGLAVAILLARLLGRSERDVANLADGLALAKTELTQRETRIRELEREVASARDQVRPLSDEVDRLRRQIAARKGGSDAAETVSLAAGALTMLKGVGPKLVAELETIGVSDIGQIAAWSADEAAAADARLGTFAGRIARDQLVAQAQLLVDGRITEYEARFGKIEAAKG